MVFVKLNRLIIATILATSSNAFQIPVQRNTGVKRINVLSSSSKLMAKSQDETSSILEKLRMPFNFQQQQQPQTQQDTSKSIVERYFEGEKMKLLI